MSIIFKALNKAARDYRQKSKTTIVPLVKRPHNQPFYKEKKVRYVLLVLAFTLFIGLLFNDYRGKTEVVAEALAASPTNEEGISLPIQSTEIAEELLEEVERTPEETPLFSQQQPSTTHHNEDKSRVTIRKAPQKKTLLTKASIAIDRDDLNSALKLYNEILQRDPENITALHGMVYVLTQRAEASDLAQLAELAARYPNDPEIHAAQARIFGYQNAMTESLAAWQRAVFLSPLNATYVTGLAITYDRMGRGIEAIKTYARLPLPRPIDAQERLDYLTARHLSFDMSMEP